MLDHSSSKPLYVQLEELIREKLEKEIWVSGDLIPSENELSKECGVSRMTVRNVITKLVQEGLLFRIPGKGTYVSEPKIIADTLSYAGIREQLEKMGYEVTTKLLEAAAKTGTKEMCDVFEIEPNSLLYTIKRIRYVRNEPFSLHTSYIPVELAPGLDKLNLVNEQLCTILSNEYGLIREHTQETLESVAATKEEAKLLNIPIHHPLLLLQDTIIGKNGKPFEISSVLFRGEKIKLRLEF
ncbi:MAG TPA: GntR family transcriptional regulator [Clostridiaceae bacterium]|nr:GntR family transcriptional regulator [Clostridiaceae bacterium]